MSAIFTWKTFDGSVELYPHSKTACRAKLYKSDGSYSITHENIRGIPVEWLQKGHLAEILSHTHIRTSRLGENFQLHVIGSIQGGGAGPSKGGSDSRSGSVEEKATGGNSNADTSSSLNTGETISPHLTYVSPRSQDDSKSNGATNTMVDLAKEAGEFALQKAHDDLIDAAAEKTMTALAGETAGKIAGQAASMLFMVQTCQAPGPDRIGATRPKEQNEQCPEDSEKEKPSQTNTDKSEKDTEKTSSSSSYDSRYSSDSASDHQLDQRDNWSSSDYSDSSSSYLENGYRTIDGRDDSDCFGRDWQEGNARDAQADRDGY